MRAILGRHALRVGDSTRAAALPPDAAARSSSAVTDPTLLVPASSLRRLLEAFDPAAQSAVAHDYVRLWGRTFRTLARHLRGRPERALTLFAEEVYPFLRGDRRAARVERLAAHEARVLLANDLPAPYLCGLLEGFVGLSGAQATARAEGGGAFAVAFRIAPVDRLARTAQHVAALRLPLVACAFLAALTGVALAASTGFSDGATAAAVLAGTVAAQLGANTLHDLRRPAGGPLAASRIPRPVLRASNLAAYALAAACAGVLVARAGPGILAFAAVGLLLGIAYSRFRAEGLGPAVAGGTYGLLIPAGALFAFDPGFLATPVVVPLIGAPLGLMAAALLLLDNLADRPLDEAGGQRTLAVRLPSHAQGLVFSSLVAAALIGLAILSGVAASVLPLVAAVLLAIPAGLIVRRVHRSADDPHALGPARLATFILLLAVAACVVLTLSLTGA